MNENSSFNSITLDIFDVSNMFHASIWVVYTIWHVLILMSIEKHVWHVKKI